MKDKSNERIIKAIIELKKVMEKEGRGFVFCPVVQLEGDHNTMCAIDFGGDGEIDEECIFRFWATMGSLIKNVQSQIPEDLLPTFKEGFLPFVQMTTEICFPTIKIIK